MQVCNRVVDPLRQAIHCDNNNINHICFHWSSTIWNAFIDVLNVFFNVQQELQESTHVTLSAEDRKERHTREIVKEQFIGCPKELLDEADEEKEYEKKKVMFGVDCCQL